MRRAFLVCGFLCGSLVMAMPAWAQFGGGGFGQPAPKPVEDPRPIQLEITILDVPAMDVPAKPLTDEQQLARLERLESENKLAGLQRLKLNLIAEQPSQLQIGESVNVVVGRSRVPGADPSGRGGGFGQQEMTRVQEVGTLVQATARAVANGAVAEIKLERSGMPPTRAGAPDAPVAEYPKRNQMTVSTTLLLKNGENTIIASSVTNQTDRPREETWIIARVTVAAPEKAPAAAAIKIFHLKRLAADSASNMLTNLFNRADLRIIPDARTNTIIVASAPEDVLQQIEAILMKLDEQTNAAATPQVRKIVPIPDDSPFVNPRFKQVPAKVPQDELNNLNPGQ